MSHTIKITALYVFIALTIMSCSGVKSPPSQPPEYTGTAPEITDGKYATYSTERTFDAPLIALRRYIEDGNKIVAAMEETDKIKKPIDVTVLSGTWPEEGSVRRLEFSDGHFVLERVIKNDFPNLFRYQVWNFTTAAGSNLEYAIGQQSWDVMPDGRSKLIWTYSLKPNASYKRLFVKRFLDNNMKPLMDNALDVVKLQSDQAFSEE